MQHVVFVGVLMILISGLLLPRRDTTAIYVKLDDSLLMFMHLLQSLRDKDLVMAIA